MFHLKKIKDFQKMVDGLIERHWNTKKHDSAVKHNDLM